MSLRDAIQKKKEQEARLERSRLIVKAEQVEIDGSVEVAGRPGFVWVKELGQPHAAQVFSAAATRLAGLPVLVGPDPKDPSRRQIIQPDFGVIANTPTYDGSPYLPDHAADHIVRRGAAPIDPVWVYDRALMMLRTSARAAGGLQVDVTPLLYVLDGAVVSFTGRTGIDLSAYLPAGGKARFVLTYLDLGTNEVGLLAGDETVDSAAITPPPPFVPANSIPSALVRLAGGMADVTEADVWDLRLVLNEVPAAGGGGGGGDEDGDIPCCGA